MIDYTFWDETIDDDTEFEGIEIDGIFYVILGDLEGFYYLINPDDKNDFLLMKEDGEDLVSVRDENEFMKALMLFRNSLKEHYSLTDAEVDRMLLGLLKK